ncbi:putative death-receptor fusion protein-domain-containing protein [Polychytrium aggregatum]|uniref:putative death-receptor fusion protein-domain-containing protein n=1 Tax=Polychytrium aggregatum TaxID=110093 RepID=UPI0022FDEB90|nr:putative death-receptor fusion protein-domain-containing protein [Polychytrium aggregatum]KAI9205438.1 putative death-receptor fusion protein-domain-containing protein [Polychytrium aggregatum]
MRKSRTPGPKDLAPLVFPAKWTQRAAEYLPANKSQASVLAVIRELAQEHNARSQCTVLKRLASTLSAVCSQTLKRDHVQFISELLAPLFVELYFGAPESQIRVLIIAVLAKSREFIEDDPQFLDRMLASGFSNALQAPGQTLARQAQLDRIVHICGVIQTTADWPIGRQLLANAFETTSNHLASQLAWSFTEAQALIAQSKISGNGATTQIEIQKYVVGAQECLKAMLSLWTKFTKASAEHIRHTLELGNDSTRQLLAISFALCFSGDFPRDIQFLAGVFAASLLQCIPVVEWGGIVFAGSVESQQPLAIPGLHIRSSILCEEPYAVLSFVRGCLAVLDVDDLVVRLARPGESSETTNLLEVTYTEIIKICDSNPDSGTRVMALTTLAQCLERISEAQGLDRSAQVFRQSSFEKTIHHDLYGRLFAYVFDGWNDPVDKVQHCLRDIFHGLLAISSHYEDPKTGANPTLSRILDNLLKSDWHQRVKYDLLSLLLTRIPPSKLLALRPDFLSLCFDVMRNAMMVSPIAAFLNRFFEAGFKEPEEKWKSDEWWLVPVIESLTSEAEVLRKAMGEHIAAPLMKQRGDILAILMEELRATQSGQSKMNISYRLHGLISVLKAGRTVGAVASIGSTAPDSVFVDPAIVQQAICHPDMHIRTDALGLLCESRKQTAETSEVEFGLVKEFLTYNSSVQSPEFRQKTQAFIKKFLIRLRRTLYGNWRDYSSKRDYLASRGPAKPSAEEEAALAVLMDKLNTKASFLHWLYDFLIASLFPGSSFQRVTSSLSLMAVVQESEAFQVDDNLRVDPTSLPINIALAQRSTVSALLSTIDTDNYDANRKMAYQLLIRFQETPGLESDGEIQQLLDLGLRKVCHIRANECDAGSVLLRLLFCKFVRDRSRNIRFPEAHLNDIDHGCPMLNFIDRILAMVKSRLDAAASSLLALAVDHPVHGLVAALVNIVEEIQYHDRVVADNRSQWAALLNDLFDTVERASLFVLPVLSDASAAGHLPSLGDDNEEDDMLEDDAVATDGDVNLDEKSLKNQLVLHQSFRVIKEGTALITAILVRSPLSKSDCDQDGLVSFANVTRGGDLLKMLLMKTRHRGAFSSVHEAFAAVTTAFLKCPSTEISRLPLEWLENFIHQVQDFSVSTTRRSAGLPYGVLAVISAPIPAKKAILTTTIERLLKIAFEPIDAEGDERLDLPQAHAYNVIRAVLTDASIVKDVRDYFSDGFILSIRGFSSSSFPIRNCAAMLFSTLITKALGVKKSRDEQHSINTVTGREFFTRFPKLHGFLLQELEVAVSALETGKIHPALYPILTILARLKPSILETEGSENMLSTFRPVVHRCSRSSILQAREMSARAFASLIAPSELMATLSSLLAEANPGRQNHLHGILLQTHALLSSHLSIELYGLARCQEIMAKMPALFESIWWVFAENTCAVTTELATSILGQLFVSGDYWKNGNLTAHESSEIEASIERHFATIRPRIWKTAVARIATADSSSIVVARFALRRSLALLVLQGLKIKALRLEAEAAATDLQHFVLLFLFDHDYEVQLAVLEFVDSHCQGEEPIHALGVDLSQLQAALVTIVEQHSTYHIAIQKAAKLLTQLHLQHGVNSAYVSRIPAIWDLLMKRSLETANPNYVEAIMPLLGSLIPQISEDKRSTYASSLIAVIGKWSDPNNALSIRVAAVDAFKWALASLKLSQLDEHQSVDTFLLIDRLLKDEEPGVREEMAAAVSAMVALSEPIIATKCRGVLVQHMCARKYSAEGALYLAKQFSVVLDLEHIVLGSASGTKVLFAKEEHNSHHEDIVDVLLATAALKQLMSQYAGVQESTRESIRHQIASNSALSQSLEHFDAGLQDAAQTPSGFAKVARVVCCFYLLGESTSGLPLATRLHPLLARLDSAIHFLA